MTGPGMHQPIPLDQARAAAERVVIETLRDEITMLRADNAYLTGRNERLAKVWNEVKAERDRMALVWPQVERLVNEARNGMWSSSATCDLIMARYFGITSDKPTVREIRGALHPEEAEEYRQLEEHRARRMTVVEPDDDELNASIARHPAGGAR